MLRIKIINELESPHRQQLENKQLEIDHLKEELYRYRREVDLAKTETEAIRMETSNEISDIRQRQRDEIEDLRNEVSYLRERTEDTKNKDRIASLVLDIDKFKIYQVENQKELARLREENSQLKSEKTDVVIRMTKLFEQEKVDSRAQKIDLDNLIREQKHLKEENEQLKLRFSSQSRDIERISEERNGLRLETQVCQEKLSTLQIKIQQEKNDTNFQEQSYRSNLQRDLEDERLRSKQHQKRISELQNQIETYQNDLIKVKDQQRTDQRKHLSEVSDLNDINSTLQNQVSSLRNRIKTKQEQNEISIQQYKELIEQKASKENQIPERQPPVSGKEIKEAEQSVNKLKGKNKKLRSKLKQANKKIMELLQFKMRAIAREEYSAQEQFKPQQTLQRDTVPFSNVYVQKEEQEVYQENLQDNQYSAFKETMQKQDQKMKKDLMSITNEMERMLGKQK